MYNSPRAATVRADADSVVWSLNRMTFRTILANATNNDAARVVKSLRKVELLKDLDDQQLNRLAGAVQMVTYAPGDLIIKKGDVGNIFYLIKTGSVKCTDIGDSGKEAKYSSGDYFGEKVRECVCACVRGVTYALRGILCGAQKSIKKQATK